MKLYYSPGACSLSPHIVLRELGLSFDLEKVDTKTHKTADGKDFYRVNPKGYVPVLQLDDGQILTEGAAIVQYLADQHPASGLVPPSGTLARARVQEDLNYIATEVHKSFGPLFSPATADDARQAAKTALGKRLDHLEARLEDGRAFLAGDALSVADIYLFVVLGWGPHVGVDMSTWPRLGALAGRVAARSAVQQALQAEGLIPAKA
jgi:glutathione S-transferase